MPTLKKEEYKVSMAYFFKKSMALSLANLKGRGYLENQGSLSRKKTNGWWSRKGIPAKGHLKVTLEKLAGKRIETC